MKDPKGWRVLEFTWSVYEVLKVNACTNCEIFVLEVGIWKVLLGLKDSLLQKELEVREKLLGVWSLDSEYIVKKNEEFQSIME